MTKSKYRVRVTMEDGIIHTFTYDTKEDTFRAIAYIKSWGGHDIRVEEVVTTSRLVDISSLNNE